jgi:hypothetical protein
MVHMLVALEQLEQEESRKARDTHDVLTAMETEIRLLKEVLKACGDQFQSYADLHTAAGKEEKARTNQRFADICKALSTLSATEDGQ